MNRRLTKSRYRLDGHDDGFPTGRAGQAPWLAPGESTRAAAHPLEGAGSRLTLRHMAEGLYGRCWPGNRTLEDLEAKNRGRGVS
jgi:hypothetical protein